VVLADVFLERAGLPLLFPEVEQRRAAEGLKRRNDKYVFIFCVC
jgi:hypothetical protein